MLAHQCAQMALRGQNPSHARCEAEELQRAPRQHLSMQLQHRHMQEKSHNEEKTTWTCYVVKVGHICPCPPSCHSWSLKLCILLRKSHQRQE